MSTQSLIWNVLVFGVTVYLIDRRGWDEATILLALFVASWS